MAEANRVPAERRRRRPTRGGVLLSADLIIDTAVRLSHEHGPEGLSVRRLGAALSCDPSAVYRYFHSTDDLHLAIADRLIGEAMRGFTPDDDWTAALRGMALRIRAVLLAHPRLAVLAASRVTRRENEFRAVETGIAILLRAGFGAAGAVRAYHLFIDTVLGHAALEAAALALPDARREADERAWTDAYQSCPDDTHPALAAVRHELHRMGGSAFEAALDVLLTGLRQVHASG
ncbi:TetR/AcrR family transcriptional regulator [Streptomyces sp. SL13]|uniref:TetR/AcrR family transcriptional regulator n=1 Tax=Streptantibioticus silvisoli TaxID=2705255 RepID=A0AA90KJD0_9ACTN|nr:TetR/AcrR family transcriptional regulator [Streptantibioticus silvisoli]MDI5973469.1 TetR/AcrR family transcriptional regulator [Streptantibioticus silvisoli]